MARPTKQGEKYKGGLSKTIKVSKLPVKIKSSLLEDKDPENKELEKLVLKRALEVTGERLQKISALLEHYNISEDDPDKWLHLSWNLACTHIEGFKVQEKGDTGAPIKWNQFSRALLYYDAKIKIESSTSKNKSDSWACEQLVKTPFWENFLGGDKSPKKLKSQLSASKKEPFVLMMMKHWEYAPIFAEAIRSSINKPQ